LTIASDVGREWYEREHSARYAINLRRIAEEKLDVKERRLRDVLAAFEHCNAKL
jgi:hypothetical protein